LKYKKGHNSGKIVEKSSLSNLTYIHFVFIRYTHTTPSLTPTFRSQGIIRKPIRDGRMDDTHYYSFLRRRVGG